jgi:hypothetical protein
MNIGDSAWNSPNFYFSQPSSTQDQNAPNINFGCSVISPTESHKIGFPAHEESIDSSVFDEYPRFANENSMCAAFAPKETLSSTYGYMSLEKQDKQVAMTPYLFTSKNHGKPK